MRLYFLLELTAYCNLKPNRLSRCSYPKPTHMEILHHDNGQKGRFYIELDGKTEAEMTYVWAGENKIIIDHTEVGAALAGKGAGKQMVTKAVEFAREKNIKILPLCPFAKSVFDKVEAFSDVLG